MISNRVFFILVGATCFSLLSFGYYLQFFAGVEPCPMCIFQRLCYLAAGTAAVVGAIHGPGRIGGIVYIMAIAVPAAIGAGIAGRQTWLQHLPPELVPECGPGLEFMLDMYPLLETIERSLRGTGDCAEVAWTFLSLSIAEWSLVCFVGILAAAAWQLLHNRRT
jgi:protein dithiol:quinone oxidoreductase